MLLVYGFIEEPRILVHGGGAGQNTHIRPTALTRQLAKSHPGLLVAGMVALHENNKVQLEQADHIFTVCMLLFILINPTQQIFKMRVISIFICVCSGAGLWELLTGGFLGGNAHGFFTGSYHPRASVQGGISVYWPTEQHTNGYVLWTNTHTAKTQAAKECRWSGTWVWMLCVKKKWRSEVSPLFRQLLLNKKHFCVCFR